MASYPSSIYSPRTKENRSGVDYDETKKTVIFAEDIVKDDDEIVALETDLIGGITTIASSATPAPTGDKLLNTLNITALAEAATFAAPSGTPRNGNRLIVRIKDNGTARSLSWNAIYRALEFALPTTTVLGKVLYLGFVYNSQDSKWDLLAINQQS